MSGPDDATRDAARDGAEWFDTWWQSERVRLHVDLVNVPTSLYPFVRLVAESAWEAALAACALEVDEQGWDRELRALIADYIGWDVSHSPGCSGEYVPHLEKCGATALRIALEKLP